jgi:hypothetical protein
VQRASAAFRAVDERRRDRALLSNCAGARHGGSRLRDEAVVDLYIDVGARRGVVDAADVATVAVLAQQQRRYAKLDALRIVDATRNGRLLATFEVYWHDAVALRLDDVDLRDNSEAFRCQIDGSRRLSHLHDVLRKLAGRTINAPMHAFAVDGIVRRRELPLDVFEPKKARTIDELVDHSRGKQFGQTARRGLLRHGELLLRSAHAIIQRQSLESSRRNQCDDRMNFASARDRRRFFIERGLRRRSRGGRGSDLESLMKLPRTEIGVNARELLGAIPFCVVGGIATRAYMPERSTKDIDFLVSPDDFEGTEQRLRAAGYSATARSDDLSFSDSRLGLFGRAWQKENIRINLISSSQAWVHEAIMAESFDQTGLRVIALPYLVLMKIDASRGQDQADVERMLGRVSAENVECIAEIVDRYSGDPQAADDVRQYALLGRMEYQMHPPDDDRSIKLDDFTQRL